MSAAGPEPPGLPGVGSPAARVGPPPQRRPPTEEQTAHRAEPQTTQRATRRARAAHALRHYVRGLDHLGVLLGLISFVCSLTPSLQPRSWQAQGLISGIGGAAAYGLGVAISWVVRRAGVRRFAARTDRVIRWAIATVAAVAIPVTLWLSAGWQNDVRRAVHVPAQQPNLYLGVFVIAAGIAAGIIGLARLLHDVYVAVARRLRRYVPLVAAKLVAAAVVAALAIGVASGVLYRGALQLADRSFGAQDRSTDHGIVQPQSPMRSGSPASLAPWSTLGRQGREFVGTGPSAADITRLTGRPAVEPIRAYAGLASAPTLQAEADLVLRELERTRAFDRAVLAVATTTGTGWIDPHQSDPLEYMFGGDTAIATMQYSYLPSWISFLVDQPRARQAGRTLFNTVYDHWSTLPAAHRPRLVVFGTSLGAFGASAAFSGVTDLTARTDGALFAGTPSSTELWRELTDTRRPGSPERLPVVGDGQRVLFAASPADLRTADGALRSPEVVFVQHESDPVVWWSTDLIWREPDWLDEPPGPDVVPHMRWYPVLTFWQITCDMIVSGRPPAGYGHRYGPDVAVAWAALLHPPRWTDADLARLLAVEAQTAPTGP